MRGHEWYRLLLLFQPIKLLFREGLSISTKMAFPYRRKMTFNSSTYPRRIFRSDRRMMFISRRYSWKRGLYIHRWVSSLEAPVAGNRHGRKVTGDYWNEGLG
ncbi:hypothetical protein GQ457_01G014990 [Hibiscus cannabinus]